MNNLIITKRDCTSVSLPASLRETVGSMKAIGWSPLTEISPNYILKFIVKNCKTLASSETIIVREVIPKEKPPTFGHCPKVALTTPPPNLFIYQAKGV